MPADRQPRRQEPCRRTAAAAFLLALLAFAAPGCRPAGAPKPGPGLEKYEEGRCYDGYTLFSHNPVGRMRFAPIFLVDMHGREVFRWVPEVPAIHARLFPGGRLFYNTTSATQLDRGEYGIYELARDGSVVWRLPGEISHDFQLLPGDAVLFSQDDGHNPLIKIVSRDGETLWTWNSLHHLGELSRFAGREVRAEGDWAHSNNAALLGPNALEASDPRFKRGNILFSFANLNLVGIIDYPSGEVVWGWGPGEIWAQHSPEMLPDGNILIFDNGRSRSRVVEVEPLTGRIAWEFTEGEDFNTFYSPTISNAQRLPNGNTLICDGGRGRLFEVTRAGEVVWDYRSPYGSLTGNRSIYRAYRYPARLAKPLRPRPAEAR